RRAAAAAAVAGPARPQRHAAQTAAPGDADDEQPVGRGSYVGTAGAAGAGDAAAAAGPRPRRVVAATGGAKAGGSAVAAGGRPGAAGRVGPRVRPADGRDPGREGGPGERHS